MADENTNFYPEAVKAIKSAILKSRYLAARLANAVQHWRLRFREYPEGEVGDGSD